MKCFEYEPQFNKSILDNGVRIVTENHPYSRALCAGIFVDLGTRDEPQEMSGAAHFVEHLVFKGTETRDAYNISKSLEAVGGELNAYTSRELTCFHSLCLKEHLPLALDILSDLMCNATFDVGDVKKEREVILQEIKMSSDQTEDYIYDVFFEKVYKDHDLGRSILGTPKSLAYMTRGRIFDFYNKRYHGQNIVVSVAGSVDHNQIVETMRRALHLRRKPFQAPQRKRPTFHNFAMAQSRPGEQVHILLGTPAPHLKEESRYASYIVNAALGGGMTSRLYQKIREKEGLSYSVYSFLQPFVDAGLMLFYAGTTAKNMSKVLGLIMKEIERFHKKGLSQQELEYFKRQIIGAYILDCDDVDGRMNSIALDEILFKNNRPVDLFIKAIENLTVEDIQTYAKKYLSFDKLGLLVMGDCHEDRVQKQIEKYIA